MQKYYCVYIITNNANTTLYTGVTGQLIGRIWYHKNKSVSSFSSRYNLNKLVYYEVYEDVNQAITREKQIKAGSRKKKIELIQKNNPEWNDLYGGLLY
jgi:putative endonuclease